MSTFYAPSGGPTPCYSGVVVAPSVAEGTASEITYTVEIDYIDSRGASMVRRYSGVVPDNRSFPTEATGPGGTVPILIRAAPQGTAILVYKTKQGQLRFYIDEHYAPRTCDA